MLKGFHMLTYDLWNRVEKKKQKKKLLLPAAPNRFRPDLRAGSAPRRQPLAGRPWRRGALFRNINLSEDFLLAFAVFIQTVAANHAAHCFALAAASRHANAATVADASSG